MHRNDQAILARVDRAMRSRIRPAEYCATAKVELYAWPCDGEPVPFAIAAQNTFMPAGSGLHWGPTWSTLWLRIDGHVPESWRGKLVEMIVELGFDDQTVGFQTEGLAYTVHGSPIKGIHPKSRWLPVPTDSGAASTITVFVEAASNPTVLRTEQGVHTFDSTLQGDPLTASTSPQYVLGDTRLALVDENVRALITELEVLRELSDELPKESARRWEILVAIDRALDELDFSGVSDGASAARAILSPILQRPAELSAHTLSAVGHAHIDTAWLWPFRETRRKVARTVANVLSIMDDNPELIFAMSSAQQYAWLKADHPELFERLRARVAEGRFVPVGGMWVESDTNLPSGESLVRQFLYGTRFFQREFGIEDAIGWLPDSFGYSAALPQILKQSGIERFITQKMSWNSTNRFPHHTFWWEGIDGSRVFTHFPSADMYNSQLLGSELAHAARNFEEKGWANHSLIPFGFGDGGGGPTREMMGRAHATADLEGSPRVEITSPEQFFDKAMAELPEPAVWLGEMYLEFHRGVLTTQARTKHGNRRVERLLREAELWATQAALRAGAKYPFEELEGLWKAVLLLQFHDVLPGSSITWVYSEAEAEYARIATDLEAIVVNSIEHLTPKSTRESSGRFISNAAPYARAGVGAHSIGERCEVNGDVSVENTEDGALRIANGEMTIKVRADGTLSSIIHEATGRQIIPRNMRQNLLQIHPDHPARWDAWDLDETYRNRVTDWDSVLGSEGAFLSDGSYQLTVRRGFGKSRAIQRLTVRPDLAQVDFELEVDWQERESILKVALPTSISTERWAAETQFGHVFRTTHSNTSWDAAQFEACAHRWVHVGEPAFGIAVTNEHTYGHEVHRTYDSASGEIGTVIRLSLLRGTEYPAPGADLGTHSFRYSLLVGATIQDAVEGGYALTDALRHVSGSTHVAALVKSSNPAIVIDTIKLAEDRTGDVIVRLYESGGNRATTELDCDLDVNRCYDVDFLEREVVFGTYKENKARLGSLVDFKPFQVRTLRFILK